MKNYFEVKDLSFCYKGEPPVFKNLNFCVSKGEKVLILGTGGIGKTTLLCVLSSFFDDYFGTISLNGVNLKNIKDEDKNFSYLPGMPVFLERKSILENFMYFAKNENLKISDEKLENDLKILGLNCKITSKLKEISQFDKIILAIYRSLLKKPNILFLDDQFAKLDEIQSLKMQKIYKDLVENKDLTMIATLDSSSYKFNKNCINFLNFDKTYYFFDQKLIEFADFETFGKNIINLNQFEFLDYKSKINGYIFKEENQYYLDVMAKKILIDKSFCKKLDKLNLSENEFEDVVLILKTDIDFSNFDSQILNFNLKQNNIYVFSLLGGEPLLENTKV